MSPIYIFHLNIFIMCIYIDIIYIMFQVCMLYTHEIYTLNVRAATSYLHKIKKILSGNVVVLRRAIHIFFFLFITLAHYYFKCIYVHSSKYVFFSPFTSVSFIKYYRKPKPQFPLIFMSPISLYIYL